MKCIRSFPTAVTVLLLLSISTALAQTPQPFAADFSGISKGRPPLTGKLFFSLPNNRMDMTANGMNMSMIVNGNTKTTYMVMHAQHMYMEMKPGNPLAQTLPQTQLKPGQGSPMAQGLPQIESSFDPKNPCAASPDATCKDLGPDTVNSRLCEKWQITPKNGNVTTTWVDQKLHFPIKTQTADGSSFELSNIKEGSQPAPLFDPPADYRKVDLGMMGGRPPQ